MWPSSPHLKQQLGLGGVGFLSTADRPKDGRDAFKGAEEVGCLAVNEAS